MWLAAALLSLLNNLIDRVDVVFFFTAWHEVDDSKPRFQGRLNVIDDLFGRVWQSHEDFSPFRPIVAHRLRSNTIQNETGKGIRIMANVKAPCQQSLLSTQGERKTLQKSC